MEEQTKDQEMNLVQLSQNISARLLNSIYLLDILYDISDGESKSATLLEIIKKDIHLAFEEISDCRRMLA